MGPSGTSLLLVLLGGGLAVALIVTLVLATMTPRDWSESPPVIDASPWKRALLRGLVFAFLATTSVLVFMTFSDAPIHRLIAGAVAGFGMGLAVGLTTYLEFGYTGEEPSFRRVLAASLSAGFISVGAALTAVLQFHYTSGILADGTLGSGIGGLWTGMSFLGEEARDLFTAFILCQAIAIPVALWIGLRIWGASYGEHVLLQLLGALGLYAAVALLSIVVSPLSNDIGPICGIFPVAIMFVGFGALCDDVERRLWGREEPPADDPG